MKRGAEKQLSKDDDQDDVDEEISTGFQMAKDSDLAKREIRGLPKRRSPAVPPVLPPASVTTHQQPAAAQKFGGFSGFGSTGGATSPFTFAAASPLAGSNPKPADAPAISESASNATKKFLTFLGPSSTAGAKPIVSSSSNTSKPDASGDTDEVALKYYTSLRGLNSSFLSAVSKAIDSDPFVDVADLLDQYKKHRVSVQQDYNGKSSHVKTQSSAPSPPSKPSVPAPSFSLFKPATSAPSTMPVPPTSFAGFAAPTSSAAPGTGFTPGLASSTSQPSPFGSSSTTAASSDSKPASTLSLPPFSGFTSASSSSSQLKPATSLATKESAPFSFGGSSTGATSTLLFSNPPKYTPLFGSDKSTSEEKDKEKDKPASSAPAPFAFNVAPGSKLFGETTTSGSLGGTSSIFGAATAKSAEDKEKKGQAELLPPLQPGSVFGGPPTTPFGTPAKSSPFAFGGAAASTTTPASFGFGVAPGSSEGLTPPKAGSVGFSFGSPSHVSSTTTTSSSSTSAVPGSLFGFSSTTSTAASATGAAGAGTGGASTAGSTPASTTASTPAPAPAGASTPGLLEVPSRGDTPATEGSQEEDGLSRATPGLHGAEGEGEEDEETTYTVKAKVFKFSTDREGAPTWFEMGIGVLRLKKHKETNARRVILRSTTTGKIVINFRIYPGLQPKRSGKTVAFTGHISSPGKDTQTAQYRLRVANEGAATEMTEAIQREVRLVQADSSPST